MLHVLKSAKPKLRGAILKEADKELILAIVECALNVLNGKCKLRECIKHKLRKHKKILRRLIDRSEKISSKRKHYSKRWFPNPLTFCCIKWFNQSYTVVMLNKLFLVSQKYLNLCLQKGQKRVVRDLYDDSVALRASQQLPRVVQDKPVNSSNTSITYTYTSYNT
jgi:hypothetical protein